MQRLETQFDHAMFDIYRRGKAEAKYNASIFLQLVTARGGLETARYLINQPKPSDRYTHLYERARLDLTVEALVVENKQWHPLFQTEEVDKARKRLSDYGYQPKATV
jgi:hypothetical protein